MADARGGAFTGVGGRGHGRAATLAAIARDARLTRGYVLQVVLAAAIAHIGLLMDSAPVIIGAMLISPLLAPIMGFGFAIATFDGRLLRRSLQTLAAGIVAAMAVAFVLTLLAPMTDPTPSLLARVRPSLLDLLVAIFGGVAGAYALLRKFSATLVGVAIATALIPPLATVGWGLATDRYDQAGGALLLFVTNTAAIGFMATLVARFNGFGTGLSPRQTWLQSGGIMAALALLAVPLAFSLSAIAREAAITASLRQQLGDAAGPTATVDRLDIDFQAATPSVAAVVIAPTLTPALEKSFAASVRAAFKQTARVSVIQLRSGSAEAEARQKADASALHDRELTAQEGRRLRAALAAALAIEPAAITIDSERRQAVAMVSAPSRGEPTPAVAPLLAAFPDWTIAFATPSPASVEAGQAASQSDAPPPRQR